MQENRSKSNQRPIGGSNTTRDPQNLAGSINIQAAYAGASPMRGSRFGRNQKEGANESRGRFRSTQSVAVRNLRVPRSVMMESARIHEQMMHQEGTFNRRDLDKIKAKLASYITSLPSERKMNHKTVMRVKGKVLNTFLGFIKTDMARLSIEAFPQRINKQLSSLILLKSANLCWFDFQIIDRIATLRANVFVGVNAGSNVYKIGFLCLIGIAHLPETLKKLHYTKSFELRPCITTDLSQLVKEQLKNVPSKAEPILGNLFHSIKLICSKVLPVMQISGNVKIPDAEGMLAEQQMRDQVFYDEVSHKMPEDLLQDDLIEVKSLRKHRDKSAAENQHSKSFADFPIKKDLQMSRASIDQSHVNKLGTINESAGPGRTYGTYGSAASGH